MDSDRIVKNQEKARKLTEELNRIYYKVYILLTILLWNIEKKIFLLLNLEVI